MLIQAESKQNVEFASCVDKGRVTIVTSVDIDTMLSPSHLLGICFAFRADKATQVSIYHDKDFVIFIDSDIRIHISPQTLIGFKSVSSR